MSIQEIESAITQLPATDVSALLTWLADYHAKLWDAQIEGDLDSGRLDALHAQVDAEYKAGLASPMK
jgi:hypothetical protein